MKILNVNTLIDVTTGGGTAQRTVEVSKNLLPLGHEVSILTFDINITDEIRDDLKGVNIIPIKCINKRFFIPSPNLSIIYKAVKDADIIHLMNYWTLINVIIFIMAKLLSKPYVLCPAGSLKFFGRSLFIKKLFHNVFGKHLLNSSAGMIAVTQDESNEFIELDIPKNKISLIPNAICNKEDISFDNQIIEKLNLTGEDYLFYIGRLNEIKGTDLLVKSFININKKYPKLKLIIAGPDEGLLSPLSTLVKENNLEDRVKFIGFVNFKEKFTLYKNAKLLVIPSRLEAMSIVVLEGGIVESPVLLTDTCGLNYLEDQRLAKVSSPTVESLTENLELCLSNTDFLNESGPMLSKHIEQTYTWNSVIKNYHETYSDILKRNNI